MNNKEEGTRFGTLIPEESTDSMAAAPEDQTESADKDDAFEAENEMIEDESDGIPDEDAGETEEEDTEDEDVMDDESDDGEIPEDEDGSEDMSVSNVAKRRKRKHRKRKTGMGKKPWIIAGSIVGALVVIYLGISAFLSVTFILILRLTGRAFRGKRFRMWRST